jgi:hypothetical protein
MIEYRYFERFILVVTIILLSTASYDCQFEVNSSHFEVTMNGYQSNLSEPTVSACNVVKHKEDEESFLTMKRTMKRRTGDLALRSQMIQ